MTPSDPARRRLLAYLAALGGLGALGGIAWIEHRLPVSEAGPEATPATLVENTASTQPMPSSSTSTSTTTSTSTSTTSTTTTTEPVPRLLLAICPEAWGALPIAGDFKSHTIERLTVHHTAVAIDSNTRAPARARQHQRSHQDLGWPDLAYHYLVDANGNVYEGRPIDAVGDTSTEYDPSSHFLVCCEGHFDEQEIPEPQLEALVDMLAWAATEFNVSPETIRGHRDWARTACPGDDLYSYVSSGFVEDAVNSRLAEGGVRLERVCGDEAVALVADIEAGLA